MKRTTFPEVQFAKKIPVDFTKKSCSFTYHQEIYCERKQPTPRQCNMIRSMAGPNAPDMPPWTVERKCTSGIKIGQRIPEGDYLDKPSKMDFEAKAFRVFQGLKNTRKMSSWSGSLQIVVLGAPLYLSCSKGGQCHSARTYTKCEVEFYETWSKSNTNLNKTWAV